MIEVCEMKEQDWFDSIIRNEISTGKITTKDELDEMLSLHESEHGMSEKVGDKLYKKYKKAVQ